MKTSLIVSLLFLMGCGFQNRSALVFESDQVQGIICTNPRPWQFLIPVRTFWIPTKEQVLNAEAEIERFLKNNPPDQSPDLWQKLPHYYRQYVGFIVEGELAIYCNFHCSDEGFGLTCTPIVVDDGGDCFFQITYDVGKRKVRKLTINGSA